MKLYLVLFLLFSLNAYADPKFGVIAGDSEALIIGDNNLFSQDNYEFGIQRYGGGESWLQVGNGLGINLGSEGGVFMNTAPEADIVKAKVGLEVASGHIVLNTNGAISSYYQWLPMVSAGPQVSIFGYELYLAARAGGSVGDFGNAGLLPHFHNAFGYGIYFDRYLSVTHTIIGDAYMNDIMVENENICLKLQDNHGSITELNYIILAKLPF